MFVRQNYIDKIYNRLIRQQNQQRVNITHVQVDLNRKLPENAKWKPVDSFSMFAEDNSDKNKYETSFIVAIGLCPRAAERNKLLEKLV